MRVVVTGASGTVGREVVRGFIKSGHDVIAYSRTPVKSIVSYNLDLINPDVRIFSDIKGIHAVIHLAAFMPLDSYTAQDYHRGNAECVEKLLRASIDAGVKNFIYASSASVIGTPKSACQNEKHLISPNNPYSASKLEGEIFCEDARRSGAINTVSLRLASVYGPGMDGRTVLPYFIRKGMAGEDIEWYGTGGRSQDFINSYDVAQAIFKCVDNINASGVYCLGSGQPTSMKELALTIAEKFPNVSARQSVNADPQEGQIWCSDITKIQSDTGYQPSVNLSQGISDYISHL